MCATQKYAGKGSNATSASSTVAIATDSALRPTGRFTLEISGGEAAEGLFWSLQERRATLLVQLRDTLLEKSPEGYLETLTELEQVDDCLTELFLSINGQLVRATEQRMATLQRQQAQQQRLNQLLTLPGWAA